MTFAGLLILAIKASILLMVLSIGMSSTLQDATAMFRRPRLLLRSALAMYGVMFVFAVVVVQVLDLHPAIEIALVALSLSPIPPLLPKKVLHAGGPMPAAVSLVTAMSVLAIVIVPLGIAFVDLLATRRDLSMPVSRVAMVIVAMILAPLAVGIGVHRAWPRFADRVAPPLRRAANISLGVAVIPLLVVIWPRIAAMLPTAMILVLVLFAVVGMAVGHVLADPAESHREVLALSTSARHPGMALAIAGFNFPDERGVIAVVACHVIISGVLAIPYLKWQEKRAARGASTA